MKYLALFFMFFIVLVMVINFWRTVPLAARRKALNRMIWLVIPAFIAAVCVLATILLATNGASVRLI